MSLGPNTLVIDARDLTLGYHNKCIVLRQPDCKPRTLPLTRIGKIVCLHSVVLSTQLLGQLVANHIDFIHLNQRYSDHSFALYGAQQGAVERHLQQYRAVQTPAIRVLFAKRLLALKFRASKKYFPMLASTADQSRARLQSLASIDQFMGVEGSLQAQLYQQMGKLLASDWHFSGRNRRPPKDPVNALLSLTYTLVYHDAVRALLVAGLDPKLGFLHECSNRRHALACDLMEPLRPSVERWVIHALESDGYSRQDFTDGIPCMLQKQARAKFYKHYEAQRGQWFKTLVRYSEILVKAIHYAS